MDGFCTFFSLVLQYNPYPLSDIQGKVMEMLWT